MELFIEINRPKAQNLINQQILYGIAMTIPAIELLSLFSDSDFEKFIQEWATGYLYEIVGYKKVFRDAGAGDKGRDEWHYAMKSEKFGIATNVSIMIMR